MDVSAQLRRESRYVVVAYLLWRDDATEPTTPPPEPEADLPEPRPIASVPASAETATEEVVPADPAPEPPVTKPVAPDLADEVPEPVVLPALDGSDAFVREQLAPELGAAGDAWLDEPDLVLRAAAVIANGRDGNVPRRLLGFVTVPGKFAVDRVGRHRRHRARDACPFRRRRADRNIHRAWASSGAGGALRTAAR